VKYLNHEQDDEAGEIPTANERKFSLILGFVKNTARTQSKYIHQTQIHEAAYMRLAKIRVHSRFNLHRFGS
jgi:hypothetical protein